MDPLLAAIVLWLSANFGFAASVEYPRVEFAHPNKILALRYRGVTNSQGQLGVSTGSRGDIVSIYDDDEQTIYLPEGWSGRSAAELSILVHEVVHHLQNREHLKFECPAEREKIAYQAQERWLALFGLDLFQEFGLDKMSIFVKTKCFY